MASTKTSTERTWIGRIIPGFDPVNEYVDDLGERIGQVHVPGEGVYEAAKESTKTAAATELIKTANTYEEDYAGVEPHVLSYLGKMLDEDAGKDLRPGISRIQQMLDKAEDDTDDPYRPPTLNLRSLKGIDGSPEDAAEYDVPDIDLKELRNLKQRYK